MNIQSITALLMCAGSLVGCDDMSWTRAINLLNGQIDNLTDQSNELTARIAALQADGDVDEQELSKLRQELAALSLQLASVGATPTASDPLPSQALPEPETPVSEAPNPRYAYDGLYYGGPCNPATDSRFRLATCSDDGILYKLDDQLGWYIP